MGRAGQVFALEPESTNFGPLTERVRLERVTKDHNRTKSRAVSRSHSLSAHPAHGSDLESEVLQGYIKDYAMAERLVCVFSPSCLSHLCL